MLGAGGPLTNLVKDLTQIALQCEMDNHLQENTIQQGGNRRNGIVIKTMKIGIKKLKRNPPILLLKLASESKVK